MFAVLFGEEEGADGDGDEDSGGEDEGDDGDDLCPLFVDDALEHLFLGRC